MNAPEASSRLAVLLAAALWRPVLAGAPDAPATPPQEPSVAAAMASIRGEDIVRHAGVLCAARFAGREAGGPGARLAADYIASQFRKTGLAPGGSVGTFFQTFKIRAGYRIASELEVTRGNERESYERRKHYMPVHVPRDDAEIAAGCVLVGYGVSSKMLDFDEYAGVDVRGKAVIVFSGVPWSRETADWLWRLEKRSRDTLIYKARTAAAHEAALLVLVDDPAGWRRSIGFSEQLRLPDCGFPVDSPIPIVQTTRRAAARLAGMKIAELHQLAHRIRTQRQPHSVALTGVTLRCRASISGSSQIGRNVIGVLPGTDPDLRTQSVVIGAHYDHLGEWDGDTFFGANDNAAGVGAVLRIAAAFRALPEPPRRTLIFIAFAAEEIGKLGSSYYVAHPCMPTAGTTLMINFDMIGRNDPNQINAVATRSSDQVHRIHQEVNRYVGLQLVHPDNMRLGRSDHTAFYMAGIPVVYFFGGRHPDYNTPGDTPDKLIPEKLEKVARLAFLTARCVADSGARAAFTGYAADWY